MNLPSTFTIFGNTVTIEIVDKTDENQYGYWDDVNEKIVIALNVKGADGWIKLRDDQILSTFLHEMIHSMQWYSGIEYSEVEASTYSNMLMEILRSSGYKLILNDEANIEDNN